MTEAELRVLAEAAASAPDELTRRLLLNVLLAEVERLRKTSAPGRTMLLVRDTQ